MKRSIICLLIFAAVVLSFCSVEIVYANSLAKFVDKSVESCLQASDNQLQYSEALKISDKFEKCKSINELFFSKKLIDKFETEISDLLVYCKAKDSEHIQMSLMRLKLYTDHLYSAGIF